MQLTKAAAARLLAEKVMGWTYDERLCRFTRPNGCDTVIIAIAWDPFTNLQQAKMVQEALVSRPGVGVSIRWVLKWQCYEVTVATWPPGGGYGGGFGTEAEAICMAALWFIAGEQVDLVNEAGR